MAETLGIVLVAGDHARSHAAFLIAAGAAALGRRVVVFATGAGVLALCADWARMAGADNDAELRSRGVAGFAELRDAVVELGCQLIACESGLLANRIGSDALLACVSRAGITQFLEMTRGAQLLAL